MTKEQLDNFIPFNKNIIYSDLQDGRISLFVKQIHWNSGKWTICVIKITYKSIWLQFIFGFENMYTTTKIEQYSNISTQWNNLSVYKIDLGT